MEYVALTASIAAFTLCLHFFHVVALARRIIEASRTAVTTMRSAALNDDEKETAVQRAAVDVGRSFVALAARLGASVLLSLAVILPGAVANVYSMDSLAVAAGNGYFIAVSSLFVIAAMICMR